MTELDALLILNAIPGLSNTAVLKLLEFFGSAVQVLKQNKHGLLGSGVITEKAAQNIVDFPQQSFLEKEQRLVQKQQVRILTFRDTQYPQQLLTIPDAPLVLYVKGRLPQNHPVSIAIVGSRKASVYGLTTTEKFAMRFGELGIPVVSGMARGIDTAAHRGVIKVRGETVAVLGSGLSCIYPPENENLFYAISENGAVISEFPMDTMPLPYNFPRRNRIISGLSMGVVIIEAAEKSGALITADFALEQGRDVFAVPGRIDSPGASGTHKIIKQGAKLVSSIEDILEEFKMQLDEHISSQPPAPVLPPSRLQAVTTSEQEVLSRLTDRPVHIDQLSEQCQGKVPNVPSVLVQLELKKFIKQLPGKMFVR